MALSRGTQHWLGPEGALWRCPVARAWLTALMKPAIDGQGTTQEKAPNFNGPVWHPKSFDFSAVVRGVKKRRPLWETASLVLPLNTRPFTVCQFSVLETHRRDMRSGGWLWWIFHKQRERKNGEGGPQSHEIRCWMLSCKCLCASLQLQNKVLVMYLKKESHVR